MSSLWFATSAALILSVVGLRHLGTTWINNAGGLRVLVLAFLSVSSLIPLALGLLAWFDRPKYLYMKLHK